MVFPMVMYGCENWTVKKAECWRIDAFVLWCWRRLLREDSWPLDGKKIKPVHHKGNQSWIFIGRADAEGETPILQPPYAKNWLTGKDPDVGKDWRQEEKRTTEDEMIGWHHHLYGHEFEPAPGVGDGQGSSLPCSAWDRKEWDMTEDWTELKFPTLSSQWPAETCKLPCFTKDKLRFSNLPKVRKNSRDSTET